MISAYEVLKLHLLTEFPRQTLKCDNKRKVTKGGVFYRICLGLWKLLQFTVGQYNLQC